MRRKPKTDEYTVTIPHPLRAGSEIEHESKKKYGALCPLRKVIESEIRRNPSGETYELQICEFQFCYEEKCQWYFSTRGMCAVQLIPQDIGDIVFELNMIKRKFKSETDPETTA